MGLQAAQHGGSAEPHAAAGTDDGGGLGSTTYAASYRKDFFLPYSTYPEAAIPDPSTGGRLHVVGTAAASGAVADVYVNGAYANMSTGIDPDTWAVDWVRVEPRVLTAGEPFWVSFHSRLPLWDALAAGGSAATVTVLTAAGGVAVNGSFPVFVPQTVITWATTVNNGTQFLLHVFNNATGNHTGATTLARLLVNGVDVTAAVPPQLRAVPANQALMWTIPAASIAVGGNGVLPPGTVWTAVASWANSSQTSAAGGYL
jgi:hypothetical protein